MLILGIETSCDDTALALVEGREVLGSVRFSQKEHQAFGGVVPELAARAHQAHWKEVLEDLWSQTGRSWDDIDLLAVTQGPGLQPALLNGTTLGSFWSQLYQKPLIAVHHILGHILSVELECEAVETPALVLTVSGGHTELHLREERHITKLGRTLDDAAGEAFDKVAKMLGLGYPGGPAVSKWAEKGDIQAFELPRIYIDPQSLDFSFSGLKAAVRRIIEQAYPEFLDSTFDIPYSSEQEKFIADLCASFQHIVFLTFKKKIDRCIDRYPQIKQVHFVGGVSANTYITTQLRLWLSGQDITLLTPQKMQYCTDNGAMIAFAGGWLYQRDSSKAKIQHVEPNSRLALEDFL